MIPVSRRLARTRRCTAAAISAAAVLAVFGSRALCATLYVDARAPAPPAVQAAFHGGTAVSPAGEVIGVTNRFLTLDGRPWLPVMGEFHYVRSPATEWDRSLAQMKSAGVDIVSTYVFWNYHEEVEGQFDWSGDRDLRRFVEMAQRHGLKVILRLGPWCHAEVRFGGLPDWVVRAMPTRRNDPVYMERVRRYWSAAAGQIEGLLWKDGGPIIGVQLENEYNLDGAGEGRQHIAALKALAVREGFDVPLYTVTGWDGAVYPPGEVLPVFGGYPDKPWDLSAHQLPPQEVYQFRFGSRVSGDLGAQTPAAGRGDAEGDVDATPFLGAEFGGGIPTMYRRRPIIAADDIASMLPVELGSGVNLYGYYLFQGGRNLIGGTTLQEHGSIGGFNDLPIVDYDFQAPLGEYRSNVSLLGELRPYHYFLKTWGSALASMSVRRPAVLPAGAADLQTPRYSVRSAGGQGFLFFNNHVRQYAMAAQRATRFTVDLPGQRLEIPRKPIDIPTDAYFIWPIDLDVFAGTLVWATAQPLTQITGPDIPTTVLFASAGVPVNLAFRSVSVTSTSGTVESRDGLVFVENLVPGPDAVVLLTARNGKRARILVLTQVEARRCVVADLEGHRGLILSDQEIVATQSGFNLRSGPDGHFEFALFPRPSSAPEANRALQDLGGYGLFERFAAAAAPWSGSAVVRQQRTAGDVPPIRLAGPSGTAVEPYPEVWKHAASWSIEIPPEALQGADDVFLNIRWIGDAARLFAGVTLVDDRYYDGRPWNVALARFKSRLGSPLTVSILPLRGDAPVYLDSSAARPSRGAQTAQMLRLALEPSYSLMVEFPKEH
jgi:hypothetical protein